MKQLSQLLMEFDETKALLEQWIAESKYSVEVLKAEKTQSESTLLDLQVSTKSILGAIAYGTGGILVHHGWLRIIGSGNPRFERTLSTWNEQDAAGKAGKLPGALLVADDVLGGFFAINGGALGENVGELYYLAPDTLEWENMELPYSSFVHWALTGNVEQFYATMFWPGWEEDVQLITGDQGIAVYPFLWAEGPEIAERSKRVVPIAELWGIAGEFRRQLGIGVTGANGEGKA